MSTTVTPISIDVRALPPPQRHFLIFRQFETLAPGEAFELVNDHDPLGLLHQFKQLLPGRFTWDYRLEGPEEWRVLIGRTGGAPADASPDSDHECTCG